MSLTSNGAFLFTALVQGRALVVHREYTVYGTSPPVPAAPLEDHYAQQRVAASPTGAIALVTKTITDRAYGCTAVPGATGLVWTAWRDLGPAFGENAQCVAWDDGQFVFARIDRGGAALVLQDATGRELRRTPTNTAQGILQWDDAARTFVLAEGRRVTVGTGAGAFTLLRAVRRGAWWLGQCIIGGDHLRITNLAGTHTWRADRQWKSPEFAIVGERLIVNGPREFGPTTADYPPHALPVDPTVPPIEPPVEPPVEPPARPRVTITDYAPKAGPAPLTVTATWARQPGSGPITRLTFLSRRQGQTLWTDQTPSGHPLDDPTFAYPFPTAGTYELRLRATGPGGIGQTGVVRLVQVAPAIEPPIDPPVEPPVEPPMPDRPVYDTFVNTESPQVDHTYRRLHNGAAPDPSDMGHNHYRRLAEGWSHEEVILGMSDPAVNSDSRPWFGFVPVAYGPFVDVEVDEVAAAYRTLGESRPTPNDLGHTSWRRFAEFWSHRDILHDIKGEPLEDGGAGATNPETPGPGPVPPPTGNPLAIRTDCLTLRHSSSDTILYAGPYPAWPLERRKKILEALQQNGYTDCWIDAAMGKQSGGWLHGVAPYDYLGKPKELLPFLVEIREAGLRTLLEIGFEDNATLDKKYPVSKLVSTVLPNFIPVVDPLVSCYQLGVEVREYWTWDEVIKVGAAIAKQTARPILVHMNQRQWGPDRGDPWSGGGELAWWKKFQKACKPNKVALAFQGGHRPVEDSGGGFLSPKEELVRDITNFCMESRLGGIGVAVISAEYGHLVPDEKTKPLGKASLDAGAIGFANGGPT